MIGSRKIHFHGDLGQHLVPFETLHQHPDNPNNGDVEEIKASLRKHGCYRKVVVSERTGNILAGHHLATALHELGQEVPVEWFDGDAAAERSVLAADNRIARTAMMDEGAELALLLRIQADNPDLTGTGYTDDYLLHLLDKRDEGLTFGGSSDEPDLGMLQENECPSCGHQWTGSSAPAYLDVRD